MKRIVLCLVLFLSVQALMGAPVLEEEIDKSLLSRKLRSLKAAILDRLFKEEKAEENKEKCCGWGN